MPYEVREDDEEEFWLEWETTIKHNVRITGREMRLCLGLNPDEMVRMIDADGGPESDELEAKLEILEDENSYDGIYARVVRDVEKRS